MKLLLIVPCLVLFLISLLNLTNNDNTLNLQVLHGLVLSLSIITIVKSIKNLFKSVTK